jgi:hypothetical protein
LVGKDARLKFIQEIGKKIAVKLSPAHADYINTTVTAAQRLWPVVHGRLLPPTCASAVASLKRNALSVLFL